MPTLAFRAAILVAAISPIFAAIDKPVHVENGMVAGAPGTNPSVMVFKGIPFAAPPVGDLRWKAPKPAANWDGVRQATKFSDNCMQRAAGGGAFPPNGGDRSATQMSENCLYLNVYTAAKSAKEKRPVMVWIHGGAFTSGAGAIYEGEEMAEKGAVVVTVNYRLGVFGFFALPELAKESDRNASGNYGLLDQVAALEWVHKNIAAFGGDPKRVTIFGESAGSWSVNLLTATPLAKGLFQRAIGESGAEFAPLATLAEAEAAGEKFAKAENAPTLAALRAKSAEELNSARGGYGGADVDGYFLPQQVYDIYAQGKQNDVPMLIGSNNDEGTLFTRPTTQAQFRQVSERRFKNDADAFLKLYPFSSDKEATDAAAHSMRDQTFGWEMRTWARMETKTGKSRVYMYYFNHVPPGRSARLGVSHGSEIAFVLNWVNGEKSDTPWRDGDHKLATEMSSYWYNFAATGNPNGKGLVKWPAYQTKADQALGINQDAIAAETVPHKDALDFLDSYYANLRSSGGAGQ